MASLDGDLAVFQLDRTARASRCARFVIRASQLARVDHPLTGLHCISVSLPLLVESCCNSVHKILEKVVSFLI